MKIVTKAEGEINELHIGLGGTMSALFLKQLAQKTHRGLEGRVKAGKSAGGISFGYRPDRHPLPDGTLSTGDRSIDEREAALVRRIFADYDKGKSARTIAIELNREGHPPPRGGARQGRRNLVLLHDFRQLEARDRHPEQRTVRGPPGVEPPAVHQGPGDGQASGPAQSTRGLDHRGGAGASDRR